jgi:hypothetical protein
VVQPQDEIRLMAAQADDAVLIEILNRVWLSKAFEISR